MPVSKDNSIRVWLHILFKRSTPEVSTRVADPHNQLQEPFPAQLQSIQKKNKLPSCNLDRTNCDSCLHYFDEERHDRCVRSILFKASTRPGELCRGARCLSLVGKTTFCSALGTAYPRTGVRICKNEIESPARFLPELQKQETHAPENCRCENRLYGCRSPDLTGASVRA